MGSWSSSGGMPLAATASDQAGEVLEASKCRIGMLERQGVVAVGDGAFSSSGIEQQAYPRSCASTQWRASLPVSRSTCAKLQLAIHCTRACRKSSRPVWRWDGVGGEILGSG